MSVVLELALGRIQRLVWREITSPGEIGQRYAGQANLLVYCGGY